MSEDKVSGTDEGGRKAPDAPKKGSIAKDAAKVRAARKPAAKSKSAATPAKKKQPAAKATALDSKATAPDSKAKAPDSKAPAKPAEAGQPPARKARKSKPAKPKTPAEGAPSPAATAAQPQPAPETDAAPREKPYVARDIAVARTLADLRAKIAALRTSPDTTIALVPTMGALHEGHLTLIEKARKTADHVVVSIFVNPKQFAPSEDLATYPRSESADLRQLKTKGVALVWLPPPEIMYPEGFATRVVPAGPALELETDHRPHFFEGVATVVTKLFTQVRPDFAIFGEKDYQQLCVVRRLASDLDLGVEIVPCETVREKDGLALSSRNTYLSQKERTIAPALNRTIRAVAAGILAGRPIPIIRAEAIMHLLTDGFRRVDYLEIRDAETLAPFDPASGRPGRVLAAAWLGSTRLIDNIPLEA